MDISSAGLKLIMKFEGCVLTAYKPYAGEKYWTIGYGHYGPDVHQGMKISQAQAENFLKQDLARFVASVNSLQRPWTQNQFDALVSFSYNCGVGSLRALTKGRTPEVIAEKMLLYNKAAGGKVSQGLVRRRKAEHDLFVKPEKNVSTLRASEDYKIGQIYHTVTRIRVRKGPGTGYRQLTHAELASSESAFDTSRTGCMDSGTPIIPQDAKTVGGKAVWIKISSGWLCGRSGTNVYVK